MCVTLNIVFVCDAKLKETDFRGKKTDLKKKNTILIIINKLCVLIFESVFVSFLHFARLIDWSEFHVIENDSMKTVDICISDMISIWFAFAIKGQIES